MIPPDFQTYMDSLVGVEIDTRTSSNDLVFGRSTAAAFSITFPCPVDHLLRAESGSLLVASVDGWEWVGSVDGVVRLDRSAEQACFVSGLRREGETTIVTRFGIPDWPPSQRDRYSVLYECGALRHDPVGIVNVWEEENPGSQADATWVMNGETFEIYIPGMIESDAAVARRRFREPDPEPGAWVNDPEILDRPIRTELDSPTRPIEPDPSEYGIGAELEDLFDLVDDVEERIRRLDE